MQLVPTIPYPESEKPNLALLETLFSDWYQHFANNEAELLKLDHKADGMVFDGFYPYYFSQKKRILFIGWESVEIPGCNYIDVLYKAYKDKWVGNRSLDKHKFSYRMICIAYGILNGMPAWEEELPEASEIVDLFGSEDGTSFAFMNISKLSNPESQANKTVINAAHALSTQPRNFQREQVAILNPDIVITMNMRDKLADLGDLSDIVSEANGVKSYWLNFGTSRALLIDTCHFSARGNKDVVADIYVPIRELIRHSEGSNLQ